MGTAIKHPVPDRVKPTFVIFDIWALWRSGLLLLHMLYPYGNSGCQRVKWLFKCSVCWLLGFQPWCLDKNFIDCVNNQEDYSHFVLLTVDRWRHRMCRNGVDCCWCSRVTWRWNWWSSLVAMGRWYCRRLVLGCPFHNSFTRWRDVYLSLLSHQQSSSIGSSTLWYLFIRLSVCVAKRTMVEFFLADRTNGRAYATVLRPSVCLSVRLSVVVVCNVMYWG